MQATPTQATAAMTATHERTVTASLTFVTFTFTFAVLGAFVAFGVVAVDSFNSGCSSVAKCTALATLDSMDVKL